MDRIRKRRRIGGDRVKKCLECGKQMSKETLENSVYIYFEYSCRCGNKVNEKKINPNGDKSLISKRKEWLNETKQQAQT